MDHILFLAQERLQSIQVNLSSFSRRISYNVSNWGSETKDALFQSIHSARERSLQYNFGGQFNDAMEHLKDFWLSFKIVDIYHRCVCFLLTEVTHTHIYFGGMCFIFGTLIGIGIGVRIQENVVAPRMMRAVVASNYNGIESINVLEDLPAPMIISADQVLVQVKAAGIDYLDIKIAEGYGRVLRQQLNRYNPNSLEEFPVILGRDCSGIVVSIGKAVTKFHPGDEVWLAVPVYHYGTLSEYIVVSENFVAIKPSQLSYEGAASLPYNIMKTFDALVMQADLGEMNTAGKRVLIHAGASGVGSIAIQLVRAWGGHVTTTIHSIAQPLAHMLGADDIITYDTSDYQKELRVREKYDVILNPLGGALPEETMLEYCRPGGLVVTCTNPRFASDTYGFFMGAAYSIYVQLKYFFTKNPWLTGGRLGTLAISGEVLERVAPLVSAGQLQAVIDKAYSANDADAAFQHISKGEPFGKTVIRFRSRTLVSRSNSFL